MDICVVCLVLLLWKTTTSSPLTEYQPESRERIVEMGRGLRTVPYGNQAAKSINFAYNRLTYLPPYCFYFNGYRHLTRIELSQNVISDISNKAFRELRLLKIVDLSGNNVSSIDIGTFKSNVRLEKLDLSNNVISFQQDRPFLNSPSLESLILTDNKIDQIYSVTFYKLPRLRNLAMGNNMIFVIEPKSLAPLKLLQYLSLENTGVDRLSENMFNGTLPRVIDVSDTPLADKFKPKLKKVKNEAVFYLLNIDSYF